MSKKVLVLSANPKKDSFAGHLADSYVASASKNFDVQLFKLADMAFDPNLSEGFEDGQFLEKPLVLFQEALKWCDHLVIITPIWWGTLPAKLKGLIDRTFLPGFAFQYEEGKAFPKKLLPGKTARIVMTMDTPPWYYRWVQRAPAVHQLNITTLKFVGFTSVKSMMVGPVISSTELARNQWIASVSRLGETAG